MYERRALTSWMPAGSFTQGQVRRSRTQARALIIVTRAEEGSEPPPAARRLCGPPAAASTRQVRARVSAGVKTMLCIGAISARTAASAAAA